jgi:hypothetical protein
MINLLPRRDLAEQGQGWEEGSEVRLGGQGLHPGNTKEAEGTGFLTVKTVDAWHPLCRHIAPSCVKCHAQPLPCY